MRVLGIVCSPRKGGNTEIMVADALAAAKEEGAEVEMVTVAGKKIGFCDGCEACSTTKKCHIKDDATEILDKMLQVDGIIFGTPVYFWSASAQAKALIDRTFAFRPNRMLKGKVGAVLAVARHAGASGAFGLFNDFFALQRMVSVGGALDYAPGEPVDKDERGGGAIAYADKRGEIRNVHPRGIAESRATGRSMVRAITALQKCRK